MRFRDTARFRGRVNGVAGGSTLLSPPAGFGWSPAWSVRKTGGSYDIAGLDFDALKPLADYTYYGSVSGNASGSPANNDPANPVTPRRYVTLANAHALKERLMVAGGRYYGNIGPDGNNLTSAGVIIEPWTGQGSGRPIFVKRSTNAVAVWTLDSGSTYYTAHSVAGVAAYDLKIIPARGLIPRLVAAADLAECRTTLGSYFYDAGASRMYVTANDGRSLIGDLDIVVPTAGTEINISKTDNQSIWFDAIDIIGPSIVSQVTATKQTIFNARNVGFFGGINGLALTGPVDAILLSPRVGGGNSDGLNYHGNAAGQVRVLEYDVRSIRSGYDASGQNNATTLHETCKAIRVAGDYAGSQDRTLHHRARLDLRSLRLCRLHDPLRQHAEFCELDQGRRRDNRRIHIVRIYYLLQGN